MFEDQSLKEHIKTRNTLSIQSLVVAEWNLNDLENIENYGNYRYRPNGTQAEFLTLPISYDPIDEGNYYTDALESSTISQFLVDNDDSSLAYLTYERNRELLFSLKECFQPFRPRSGINKLMWFGEKYIDRIRSARRPRYYLASRDDEFKYWSSYRKEEGAEKGLSELSDPNNIGYAIEDAAPFVVYKEAVAANRIVLKLQTNLSENSIGEIRIAEGQTIQDPLADISLSSIPRRFSIEYLNEENNWVNAASFNEDSVRRDDSPIINWDGYLELYYGIKIPEEYKEQFNLVDYLSSSAQLPIGLLNGESYMVGADESNVGELYIWNQQNSDYDSIVPEYGFSLLEDDDTKKIGLIDRLTSPRFFEINGELVFRDVAFIKGIRLVTETLHGPNRTLDLIELSPRLKANISDYVLGFEITKSLANDSTNLPVGGLIASNGTVELMNYDSAFSELNPNSLVSKYLNPNVKFDFYEAVLNVQGFDKFIPLKTFYAENFPKASGGLQDISIELRDFFFRLETLKAPSLFLQNISLTAAIAILLDNAGFSNYVFQTIDSSNDPIIPYFFVEPDVTVAEVLVRLAVATQTAMFFDENNNFVLMSKEYLLPEENSREVNLELLGQTSSKGLVNIAAIDNTEESILNSGQINYTTRYVQRSPASFKQASYFDEDRTYIYKPVLLWEVASDEEQKTINEKAKNSSGYTLGAAPLNTTLTSEVPVVSNGQIINNIIDLGENVYWIPRFQGYFYANGEIIRYDAIEYAIPGQGVILIKSNQDYQRYFANLPFNGKMYPTGNVRIYVEPFFEELNPGEEDSQTILKEGEVKSHGRGQFGTEIVEHNAGLSSYWSDNEYVRGCQMKSEHIFGTKPVGQISLPPLSALGPAIGVNNTVGQQSSRNGIIANFHRENIPSDDIVKTLKTTDTATLQSSAFIFGGPNPMPQGILPRDFVSYVYKELDNDFTHFGTRMRIIGKKGSTTNTQSPSNSTEYFTVSSPFDQQSTISGGSGGIGVNVNPEKNYGYFFEIMSLTTDSLEQFTVENETTGETTVVHNIIFYKVVPGTVGGQTVAIPVKLFGGIGKILVDDGRFVGQDRLANQTNPTVYDLAVEYELIGATKRFYLYLNNTLISIVDDPNPLPNYNNICLFVRGSSKSMFENIYAMKNVYSKETGKTVARSDTKIFEDNEITASEVMRKYSVSGFIKSSYLSGISADSVPKHDLYFEEFGTILRECAYFNIKYDKAYPAFISVISPTLSKEKSYTISGFRGGSYGAEFLIFNNTDKLISLDETTGNYLRIFGITFTQSTSNVLTVDDYFRERSNLSDPIYIENTLYSPQRAQKTIDNIRLSRSKYGKKEFSLDSVYIQNEDTASNLMSWLISKTIRPRKKVFLESFGTSHLQLGDLVTIDYDLPDGYKFVEDNKKFIVFSISYKRNPEGPEMSLGLVEV